MTYPLIGIRSHFSLGESTLTPKQIKAAAAEVGAKTVVVADTMTISGLIEISKLRDDNFDPRVGVRLRVVSDLLDAPLPEGEDRAVEAKALEDEKKKLRPFYPKAFARNADGMRAIMRALSRAFEEDRFFKVPRLTVSDLLTLARDPNIVITTGDTHGLFTWPDYAKTFSDLAIAAEDRLWIEFVPANLPYFDACNKLAVECAVGTDIRGFVSIPTVHAKGDFHAFRMNMAIHNRSTKSRRFSMHEPYIRDWSPKTASEALTIVAEAAKRAPKREGLPNGPVWKSVWSGSEAFVDAIAYIWKKEKISLPKIAEDPDAAVARACIEGLKQRLATPVFGEVIPRAMLHSDYTPRLKYELQVLKDKEFATYFLVVADLVQWAKRNGIFVGPGRGSVGGSLVAYLMGITEVDPIRFGLLFERFISPARPDLPDADLDFMSTRREEVVRYMTEKYGSDKVAGISNYGEIGAASGLNDVGRVHEVAPEKIAGASKLVPKVHGQPMNLTDAADEVGQIAAFRDEYPTLWKEAVALDGVMRSYGKHAAGVVVSGVPLVERAVVERRSDAAIINWDMRTSEDMGLVKLDILGLSTLDTIARALEYIRKRHGKIIDINAIPIDDAKTLQAFSEGRCQGVFQFEGGAARRILKDMSKVTPVAFSDLVAANALNRPGPIDAGLVQKYVDRKNGDEAVDYPHPCLEPILKDTFGVIAYQEQVMKLAHTLCGFSLVDAEGLRKAMGKKLKDLMAKYKAQFIEGAEKTSGMSPSLAEALFDQIEVFAGYAFNASHAVEYSLISYQCQWLKTHYPAEFFAASLSTVGEDKLSSVMKDAEESGIEILPPDINVSESEFVILTDTQLVIPFSRVKGCSNKAPAAIMTVRADGPIVGGTVDVETKTGRGKKAVITIAKVEKNAMEMLAHRLSEKGLGRYCHKGHIEALDKVGAFAKVVPGQAPAIDPARLRDQLILMPGLVSRRLQVKEKLPADKETLLALKKVIEDYLAIDEEVAHVKPTIGRKARFMVVADCPTSSEEAAAKFAEGRSFDYLRMALNEAELDVHHGYWTGLLKRVKEGKQPSPDEIRTYAPFLTREVELMKPKLIITLGSSAVRHFIPDLKGNVLDHAGNAVYLKKLDATILIGFNPAMIYFEPTRQETLNQIFATAATMIA